MNVGDLAVQVAGLMRGFNSHDFDYRLFTGFCAGDEADYLDTVATDVKATRIEGLGRGVSLGGDSKAFVSLIKEIRSFKPHIIYTHTAKAGFLGRIASIVPLHPSIRGRTFHGHLLNRYFGGSALSARMGAAAKEFTLADFGVKRLVHNHEELYKKLLTNRARS